METIKKLFGGQSQPAGEQTAQPAPQAPVEQKPEETNVNTPQQ